MSDRRIPPHRLALLLLCLLLLAGCDIEFFKEDCTGVGGGISRPGTEGDFVFFFCLLFGEAPSGAGPEARAAREAIAVSAIFTPFPGQTPGVDRPTAVSCSAERCAALNFSPQGVHICTTAGCEDLVPLPFGSGALQFSPDGRTLMAGSLGNFRILEFSGPAAVGAEAAPTVRTLVIPGTIVPLTAPPAIAFDPITARAHVCTSAGMVVLDPPYTAVAFTVPLPNCAGVAVSPDGSRIAATRNNNSVRFFAGPLTAGSTEQLLVVTPGVNLLGLAFARDGSKLIVAANSAPDLYLVDPPYGTASVVTKVSIPGVGPANGWTDVTFDPTNRAVVATGGTTPAAAADPGIAVGAFPFTAGDFTRVDVPGGRGVGAVRFPEEPPCGGATPVAAVSAGVARAERRATEAVGPLLAAVLPISRSVRVGCPATAFVTVLNPGTETATGVSIAPATAVPVAFLYQTTDATNALTGTANTPVDIPPGGAQSFVVAFTPTAPFPPTLIALTIAGTNAGAVPVLPSVNTLLLSASPARTGDPVALAATLNNNGIVDIPGAGGTGVFAVATVNVGINAAITASADTGGTALPVAVFVCQTDTATGQCLAAPAPAVTAAVAANATPSFAFFVQASGVVPFDPAVNRAFVRLRDALGVERGSTSVALRTVGGP